MNTSKTNDSQTRLDIWAGVTEPATKPIPLRVADAMTREVVTLSPTDTFADIIGLMARHSFRHYLVVQPRRRLVGVISDRDVLRAMARTPNWHNSSAQELMSTNVIVVNPETELSIAASTMLSKRINCLPVVDDRSDICGVITSTDLLKSYRVIQELAEKGFALNSQTGQAPDSEPVTFLQEYKER